MTWSHHRSTVLGFASFSVISALGWALLSSTAAQRQVQSFVFPAVPLPDWQLVEQQTLSSVGHTVEERGKVEAASRYIYAQPEATSPETAIAPAASLTVNIYYLTGVGGRVETYVEDLAHIPLKATQPWLMRAYPEDSAYAVFMHQGQAHLTSCINSQGGSTVTHPAFSLNRDRQDLQWHNLWPWLLGQTSLRDRRCLWTHVSMPAGATPESAYKTLEAAWQAWYDWWVPRFPSL